MIRRPFAALTRSALAALALAGCQDSNAPLAPDVRAVTPRLSLGATEQLDQSNLTVNNYAGRPTGGTGQSFTAGKTGQLTSIEMLVICGQSMPDATLELYSGPYSAFTAAPSSEALVASQPVSSTVWPACDVPQTMTTQEWVRVAFTTPASVVAGSSYTFRLIHSSGSPYFRVSSGADAYSGGVEWAFAGTWDMVFKTYVTDPTPPVITPVLSGTDGPDDWFLSDVTIVWNVVEPESGITATSGCSSPTIVSSETNGTTFTCSATSAGGTTERSVTVRLDKSGPSLNPVVTPNPVVLNGTATVEPNVTYDGIGLASVICRPVPTSSIGFNLARCDAYDLAGRGVVVQRPYYVVYPFTGFFAPVDAAPVLNTTKAGSAIPVKFGLGSDRGLAIMAADYPASQATSCSATDQTADLEETVTAGTSSLTYDASSARYTYVWKTEKSWAGTCRKLTVKLVDGSEHVALFKFSK